MKKTLLTALVMLGAGTIVYCQATLGSIFVGNNLSGFKAPIYNLDPGAPSTAKSGQSSIGTPTGSTVYGGALLGSSNNPAGSSYTFGFFAAPGANQPSSALALVFSTTFRTATGNVQPAGLVNSGTATIPGSQGGGQATFQIRVWNNQGGAITTWAAAEAAWLNGLGTEPAGVSQLVNSAPLGGTDGGGNPVVTPADSGWTSFQLTATVPEPTTLTLAGLGIASMLILRRRK